MMKFSAAVTRIVTTGLLMALAGSAAAQQAYPSRPIHIIVAYPAGGSSNDMRARMIADKLSQSLGQVIVENKPGAGGAIGAEVVAKSAPDGYTLLVTDMGMLIANPVLFKKMSYDPVKDFEHITQVIRTTVILSVHPSLPANSVKELVALAKSRPGQLNYATASSAFYIVVEMFKLRTGIDMLYVPYKGGPPATMALMSGEAHLMIGPLQTVLTQIKANRIRPLAVASASRSPALPDLPTMAESGLPGFEVSTFTGISAPGGTPKEIVGRLNNEIVKILRMPDVKKRLESGGDTIVGSTPEEFSAFIRAEVARYRNVVKEAGIPLIDR